MDEISKKLSEMTGKDKTELLKNLKKEAKMKQTEEEIKQLLGQTTTAVLEVEPQPTIDKREAYKFNLKPIAEIRAAKSQEEINAEIERKEVERTVKGYFLFGVAVAFPIGFILGYLIP